MLKVRPAAILQYLPRLTIFSVDVSKHRANPSIGETHGQWILLTISLVLLVRELYAAITLNDPTKTANETLFYVLQAMPELIALLMFTVPGLIPSRARGEVLPTAVRNDSGSSVALFPMTDQ